MRRRLDLAMASTVVEVTHTVAVDLHTGIQRVVRETVGQWITKHDLVLAHFDDRDGHAKALDASESTRMRDWKHHFHTSGSQPVVRAPAELTGDVLIPWGSRILIPELLADPLRCDAYRTLALAGVPSFVGMITFDMIPVTSTETVASGMSDLFVGYLSVVKHADRIAPISQSTAHEFAGFNQMLSSQGLTGPDIQAVPLPTEAPPSHDDDIEELRQSLQLGSMPLVLVVGSHEPRKNHLRVLEAAEKLWRSGAHFALLLIGGARGQPGVRWLRRRIDGTRPADQGVEEAD